MSPRKEVNVTRGRKGFQPVNTGRAAPTSSSVTPTTVVEENHNLLPQVYPTPKKGLHTKPTSQSNDGTGMLTNFKPSPIVSAGGMLESALKEAGEDPADYTVYENRIMVGESDVEISWSETGDYTVAAQVCESSGNYWSEPSYVSVVVLETRNSDHAVATAFDVLHDGVEEYQKTFDESNARDSNIFSENSRWD